MEERVMNDPSNALWIELRKATRSRMPLFTALGSLILPLIGAFFMFVYKDPEFARSIGLVSAKANLAGGTASWPSYLGLLAQGIAVGGIGLFGLMEIWVFGREFADGTLKDLLAVPVARMTILLAKFIVIALWSIVLVAMSCVVSLILGAVIGLSQDTAGVFWQGIATLATTASLVIINVIPIAFFASLGRGYLLPIGVVFLMVVFTNVIVIAGWGSYFPWSVPALYAQFTENGRASLEPVSYVIVVFTGLAGMIGTYLWWKFADQNR